MESNPTRKSSTAFEYFLYAAILAETGLAALIYKTIFDSPELARVRIYFSILYFGFLAWAITQLNRLHRDRKMQASEPRELDESDEPEIGPQASRAALGLTTGQLLAVILVFATAVAAFTWAMRALL
jgi:hypothetical protein